MRFSTRFAYVFKILFILSFITNLAFAGDEGTTSYAPFELPAIDIPDPYKIPTNETSSIGIIVGIGVPFSVCTVVGSVAIIAWFCLRNAVDDEIVAPGASSH